jgi:hypothetical protein
MSALVKHGLHLRHELSRPRIYRKRFIARSRSKKAPGRNTGKSIDQPIGEDPGFRLRFKYSATAKGGFDLLREIRALGSWAKDSKIGYRTINAQAESIDKAPSFREAFAKRRCLIPADRFDEWRKTVKPNAPFAIAMKDGRPFTFAALWDNWKDPDSGEWLRVARLSRGGAQ